MFFQDQKQFSETKNNFQNARFQIFNKKTIFRDQKTFLETKKVNSETKLSKKRKFRDEKTFLETKKENSETKLSKKSNFQTIFGHGGSYSRFFI